MGAEFQYSSGNMRLIFVILLCMAAVAQDVADSSAGFERQYRPVVNALRAGDHAAAKRALDSFALPTEWFQQIFGPNVESVQQQYKLEFDYFEYEEPHVIEWQLANSVTRFETELLTHPLPTQPPAKPAPASIQPLPEMENVKFKAYDYLHDAGRTGAQPAAAMPKFTRMNSFVYLNGAFRFFGIGGYPFWDPIRIHRPDLCDPQKRQPGGQILNVFPPTYPDEAEKKGGRVPLPYGWTSPKTAQYQRCIP